MLRALKKESEKVKKAKEPLRPDVDKALWTMVSRSTGFQYVSKQTTTAGHLDPRKD